MKVCWFSTGISSFVACYLAKDVDEIIYTHVANQHPDSLRFLHDCEKLLGRKITVLQSDEYRDVDDVIEKTRCINTPFGAPCTEKLKKRVRMKWEREHPDHHIYVWGMDATEKNRAARLETTDGLSQREIQLRIWKMRKNCLHLVLSFNFQNKRRCKYE